MKREEERTVWITDLFIDNIHFYEKERERWTSNFNSTKLLTAIQISSVKTVHSLEKLVLKNSF